VRASSIARSKLAFRPSGAPRLTVGVTAGADGTSCRPQHSTADVPQGETATSLPSRSYLPNGRSLKQTDVVIRRLEKELLGRTSGSQTSPRSSGKARPASTPSIAPHMPARNFGQLLVNTVDEEATVAVISRFPGTLERSISRGLGALEAT